MTKNDKDNNIVEFNKKDDMYFSDLVYEILETDEVKIMNDELILILEEEFDLSFKSYDILIEIKEYFRGNDKIILYVIKKDNIEIKHINGIKERLHNELDLKLIKILNADEKYYLEFVYDVIEVELTVDDIGVSMEDFLKMFEDE